MLGTALAGMMRDTKLRERQLTTTRDRVATIGQGGDPAAAAAEFAAEQAGETKHKSKSIEDFDTQQLMSTTPEVRFAPRI